MTEVTRGRTERIVIRCSRDVKTAFRVYAARYRNYEEALVELLRLAGFYPPRGRIY